MTELEVALVEAETHRCDALIANDVEALERLLDDKLSYIHASGFHEGKAGVIGNIREGRVRFLDVQWGEQTVVEIGDHAGIVAGPLTVKVNVLGKEATMKLLATCVWQMTGNAWTLIGFQSTALPAAA